MIHLGDGPQAEVHDVLVVRHPSVADLQHVRVCVVREANRSADRKDNLMKSRRVFMEISFIHES